MLRKLLVVITISFIHFDATLNIFLVKALIAIIGEDIFSNVFKFKYHLVNLTVYF